MRKIKTQTADDGTELEIKQRNSGDYIVTENGSSERTGQVVQSRKAAERQLEETSRLYGVAEDSQNSRGRSTRDSGFGGGLGGDMSGEGGLFGGGDIDTAEPDDRSSDAGGFFGGGGSSGGDMSFGRETDDSGAGFGASGEGGLFGGGDIDTAEPDDRSSDAGGFFGGGGGLFGGGSSGGRKRDPNTGKFSPSRPRDADFEMERNEDGTFKGRKDDESNSGGLFDFLG